MMKQGYQYHYLNLPLTLASLAVQNAATGAGQATAPVLQSTWSRGLPKRRQCPHHTPVEMSRPPPRARGP